MYRFSVSCWSSSTLFHLPAVDVVHVLLGERSEWRERMAEMEKELEMVREMTEEKMQDMAVALVVAHDFQVPLLLLLILLLH